MRSSFCFPIYYVVAISFLNVVHLVFSVLIADVAAVSAERAKAVHLPIENDTKWVSAALWVLRMGLVWQQVWVLVDFFEVSSAFQTPARPEHTPTTSSFSLLANIVFSSFIPKPFFISNISQFQRNPVKSLDVSLLFGFCVAVIIAVVLLVDPPPSLVVLKAIVFALIVNPGSRASQHQYQAEPSSA